MKSQKFQTKSKEKPRPLSKSRLFVSTKSNTIQNKEKNKLTKSNKKPLTNKSTSPDVKHKKFLQGSKTFKSAVKSEEEKNLKQSQETLKTNILNTEVDYSRNLISEKKVKNSIKRLIDTSQTLLDQQNNILLEADKLMQNIEVNEHEINKISKKDNMTNFSGYINDYTENLESVLTKLKKNTKDLELSNKIKEENNNLKYRIQMLSIDKNDDYRNVETELNSIKTVYSNEINSMLNYLIELGFDDIPIEHIAPSTLTTDKIINFFNLMKRTMKQLKDDSKEKDEQIKMIKKYKNSTDINKDNDNLEQKLYSNIKNNSEYSKYNTQNSFNTLNNNRLFSTINSNNNKSSNNDRIKKIEDLCLQHNYEDDMNNSGINNKNKNTYQMVSNQDEQKGQSYMDNFQRSKNMVNNDSNISLGIQLEHNYTDSYFYQNMKDSYSNVNNKNNNIDDNLKDSNNNIVIKDYISQINKSQPINKFN
jgi:hypothetical protein